jgi:acyl carrier protein
VGENELVVLFEIRRILSLELDWKGPVEPSQHLTRDLQLDSLGLTVLAVELENRFRIRLSMEDSVGVSTVGDLMRLVAARAASESSPESEVSCAGGAP